MTDNDDWHAGYREGLRDGRNISTELAPSPAVPAQPQRAPWPSDGEMLALLQDAGFDAQQAHPGCYYAFSWKTFTEKLRAAIAPGDVPQCAQVNEETLVDFLCEAQDRAGPGCDELAIAQALLATFSVTRPESNTP